MLWTAIGCLIAGVIVMIGMFVWQNRAIKNPDEWSRFNRYRGLLQIIYLLLYIAAAVLFLIW